MYITNKARVYIRDIGECYVFDNEKSIAYRLYYDKETGGDLAVKFTYSELDTMKKKYLGANRFYKPFLLLYYTDLKNGDKKDWHFMDDREKLISDKIIARSE